MKSTTLLCTAAALALAPTAALAIIDTTTGSTVDLAPVLNPMIQLVGAVVTACAGTVAVFAVNWVRGKLKMQKIQADAATQARIDDVVQKIIGGAMARANIQPGRAVVDVKNAVVADAANRVAESLGKEITSLNSTGDVAQQAKNIVENRLGLMAAAQAGTPVPGPTTLQGPTLVQPVPVVAVDPSKPVVQ